MNDFIELVFVYQHKIRRGAEDIIVTTQGHNSESLTLT